MPLTFAYPIVSPVVLPMPRITPQICRVGMWRGATLALLLAATGHAGAQDLPPEVDAALARAKVPRDAVSVVVIDAQGGKAPRISHRADVSMNPASVMKLVTTYAALDLLGPAYSWSTPVYLGGLVRDGVLKGNLHIRGQGDPIQLDYRMEKAGEGWKIYDVNVAGFWLVDAYKGQFARDLSNGGMDMLISRLAEKNKSLAGAAACRTGCRRRLRRS